MELVYLWVEDYKNIKKQGFNFSPRFRCSYDEDSNELTIEENKDYVHIFPENINVTAIVGENGSGKSNVLEALIYLIHNKNKKEKISAIFFNQEKATFCKKCVNFNLKTSNKIEFNEKYEDSFNNFLLHYNYTIDNFESTETINFNDLYHKVDDYHTPILLQPTKRNKIIDIDNSNYIANLNILNFTINKKVEIKNIQNFFTTDKYSLIFTYKNIYKNDEEYPEFKNKLLDICKKSSNLEEFNSKQLIDITYLYIIRKLLNKFLHGAYYVLDKSFKNIVKELHILRELDKKDNLDKKVKNPRLDERINQLDKILDYLRLRDFNDLLEDETEYKLSKIRNSFNFIRYIKTYNKNFKIRNKIDKIENNKDFLLNIAPWIHIELLNKEGHYFSSLSYGQKFLIKFLYSILNQLNNLKTHKEYSHILLLLDEVELGLHPKWQKEYLSLLINILEIFLPRYKFNVICASHSPFILSDIPKENIIFLEKGVQKHPFKENEQTFGANIHTLLSHGFFMKDGLMGEFAKEKINDVIKLLKDDKKELSQDEIKFCKKIVSIIGEPILQKTLQSQLDMKLYPKESELEKLEREQKELEEKIDELKKKKNETN